MELGDNCTSQSQNQRKTNTTTEGCTHTNQSKQRILTHAWRTCEKKLVANVGQITNFGMISMFGSCKVFGEGDGLSRNEIVPLQVIEFQRWEKDSKPERITHFTFFTETFGHSYSLFIIIDISIRIRNTS